MKMYQVVDGFFISSRNKLAATTQENYRLALVKLVAFLGEDRDITTVSPQDIYRYIEHLQATGLSARSVHDNIAICSSLWTFVSTEFSIPHIIKSVSVPKFEHKEIIPFTEAEVKAVASAAEWTAEWNTGTGKRTRSKRPTWRRDVAIIMIMVDTGLRVSEVCNLRVDDYHNADGRLTVRAGKGNKQRIVYCGTTTQRVIWRYLMSRDKIMPKDVLFCTKTNKRLSRHSLRHLVATIGKNAGVADVHPHRFRHTFAIQFLRNGGNVFELQRMLGHSDLDTVKIYVNLAQVDIQRAQQANSPADNWRL